MRKINYIEAVKACQKYVTQAFQDSPGSDGVSNQRPFAGWCAFIVNHIAREYGWPELLILKMPLRRLFQYQRCIIHWHKSDATMHNPSDKLVGQYLRKMNEYIASLNQPIKDCDWSTVKLERWDYN